MPEISSIVVTGHTAVIRGVDFGILTSQVIIAPSDDKADVGSDLPMVVSWADDRIEIGGINAAILASPQYWFVVDINGFANPGGFIVDVVVPSVITDVSIGWWRAPITSVAWWQDPHVSTGWWQQTHVSIGWWGLPKTSVGWWASPKTSVGWWKEV